jgi:hypothetical protein
VIEENPQGSIAFVKGIDAKELMSCCIWLVFNFLTS